MRALIRYELNNLGHQHKPFISCRYMIDRGLILMPSFAVTEKNAKPFKMEQTLHF